MKSWDIDNKGYIKGGHGLAIFESAKASHNTKVTRRKNDKKKDKK
jgi:hypothetical protein